MLSTILFSMSFFLLGLVLGFVLCRLLKRRQAVLLNLKIKGNVMSLNPGMTATAKIAPTDATGAPAPVTAVVYDVSPTGAYTIVPAADGLTAVYTAGAAAVTGPVATVKATSAGGVVLSDHAALPDIVLVTPEATALNLTVTTP